MKGGGMLLSSPSISPAFIGVSGTSSAPSLASLNFAGGVVAWGLMVPILTYFIAPSGLHGRRSHADGGDAVGSPRLANNVRVHDRAADRHRRDADERRVHTVPDAQQKA